MAPWKQSKLPFMPKRLRILSEISFSEPMFLSMTQMETEEPSITVLRRANELKLNTTAPATSQQLLDS